MPRCRSGLDESALCSLGGQRCQRRLPLFDSVVRANDVRAALTNRLRGHRGDIKDTLNDWGTLKYGSAYLECYEDHYCFTHTHTHTHTRTHMHT